MRLRKKVKGTAERPRMCVFLSNANMYVQLIDDVAGITLVSASTQDKVSGAPTVKTAAELGSLLAAEAKDKQISEVVFDRGGFVYGARIKALADAAREGGLKF